VVLLHLIFLVLHDKVKRKEIEHDGPLDAMKLYTIYFLMQDSFQEVTDYMNGTAEL